MTNNRILVEINQLRSEIVQLDALIGSTDPSIAVNGCSIVDKLNEMRLRRYEECEALEIVHDKLEGRHW
ncbi:hypothetical protein OB03_08515 [Brevundimonas sp. GN22]